MAWRFIFCFLLFLPVAYRCSNAPQLDPQLAQLAERLGHLLCVADAQSENMRNVFLTAKNTGMEAHPEFIKQKRKYHRCLSSLNTEILQLQTEFDAAVLKMGGQAAERAQLLYTALDHAQQPPNCNFKEFCRLRFDFEKWKNSTP